MKKFSVVAVLAVATLSGCVVAPVGHGRYGPRPVIVGPAVVGPPVVVVRPDAHGHGRGYYRGYDRRDDRGHGHGRWGRDRDDDRRGHRD